MGELESQAARNIRFATAGEADAAVQIWREAATWMIDRGEPLWTVEQFTLADALEHVRAARLVLGFEDDQPVAAFTLQEEDPLFWPDAEPASALYLHRVAVRRTSAGQGWTTRIIDWAAEQAERRGRTYLRLDCDRRPALMALYERAGFVPVSDAPVIVNGAPAIRLERRL